MAEHTRRTALLGGGALLATAAGGLALIPRGRTEAEPLPAPTPAAVSTAPAPPAPSPSPTGPALGTTLLSQLGEPARLRVVPALANGGVMQDVSSVPSTGTWFITQKMPGSNGQVLPFETAIVNRVRAADGALLDAMTLIDAGHGLGFEAEQDDGTTWIWITWRGPSADGAAREQDFVRLRYTPGTFTRAQADQQLGLTLVPFQDRTPEAVYHFDRPRDAAVERHWNPPLGQEAPTERFVRRRVSDLLAGRDERLGEILLRASPPTTQGFATVNDTFFRWLGAGGPGGAVNAADPIVLEQYSWTTGQLVATGSYPGIWQPWLDGIREPQGLCVQREADGTATLLLGTTTGAGGHHQYQLSAFASIGTA